METTMKKADFNERRTVIHLLRSGQTPAEVAQELERSLAWVYKWQKRFFTRQDWSALQDQSRAPHRWPQRLPTNTRQAVCQARSELEAEAAEPDKLSYIGAAAIRARLRKKGLAPVPSSASIERIVRAAGLSRPRSTEPAPEVQYPHLQPTAPHQLIQVDIVPHFLPGGAKVACFNALDVVSHYPTGQQYGSRRSVEATAFLRHVWQTLGLPTYTQVDNEGCFSGGFTHPGVLGKVVRLALFVGTELVFSPVYHPESNGAVERFHQDYNHHVWHKFELLDLAAVQRHSPAFFETYRQSEHIAALQGRSPAQCHWDQPVQAWPAELALPDPLPLTAGRVHFMRQVEPTRQISLLNLTWAVPQAQPGQGVWATLEVSLRSAKLRIYDAAPDAPQRTCLAEHPFPLPEPVQPLRVEFQRSMPVVPSWFSLAAQLFRAALQRPVIAWFSTMS
jgi:transposase